MKGKPKARRMRKDKATEPAQTPAESEVNLKKTTRLMLWMGKFFRRNFYTQEGRDIKAREYRDGRRFGIYNNRVLMGIELSYAPDLDSAFDSETVKYYKRLQTLVDSGRLGACSDDPPAPFTSQRTQRAVEDDIDRDVAGPVEEDVVAVDEDATALSSTPMPRRRKPSVVPQHRQAAFSFGSD